METEQTFFLDGNVPEPPFSELTAEELETVKRYVELVRHLDELHQLFLIFKFNLDSLLSSYRVTSSGEVFRNDALADTGDDYIAINALVISIIMILYMIQLMICARGRKKGCCFSDGRSVIIWIIDPDFDPEWEKAHGDNGVERVKMRSFWSGNAYK